MTMGFMAAQSAKQITNAETLHADLAYHSMETYCHQCSGYREMKARIMADRITVRLLCEDAEHEIGRIFVRI